jgi:hypothetical protein
MVLCRIKGRLPHLLNDLSHGSDPGSKFAPLYASPASCHPDPEGSAAPTVRL